VIGMPKTYPAYFGTYDRFAEIREHVDQYGNLFLVGRNGMHRYNNQDHSMLTAMMAVDDIIAGKRTKPTCGKSILRGIITRKKRVPSDWLSGEVALVWPKPVPSQRRGYRLISESREVHARLVRDRTKTPVRTGLRRRALVPKPNSAGCATRDRCP